MRSGNVKLLAWFLLAAGLLITEAAGAEMSWPLSGETQATLHQRLLEQLKQERLDSEVLLQRQRVQRFYALRNHSPAWSDNKGITPGAQELLSVLTEADKEGLQPGRYHLESITALMAAPLADVATLARLDILLSDAFLAYSFDARRGRFDPRNVDDSWHIVPSEYDFERALQYALESNSILASLHSMPPYQRGYRRLRNALALYRDIVVQGGWPQLVQGGSLKLGMHDTRVAVLRRRLGMSGDLPANAGGDAQDFDSLMELAVHRFQSSHGIPEDGVVGEQTRLALNVPVEQRIGQLLASMERWRWMPRHLEQRYVLVNMTGFRLDVIDEDLSIMHMRVIIGKDYRQTPAFGSRLTAMTFNPSWYVPRSIFHNDMLPELKRDGSYLAKRNISVLDAPAEGRREIDPETIDWSSYDEKQFPYVLRQPPGSENPLGKVKFVIPNNYRIYLHDTPHRSLFSRQERTFSSGCIRLEKPIELAGYLLEQEPDAMPGQLEKYLSDTRTTSLKLKQSWPIYLVYWTAWADEDGLVQFRDDVYNRDTLLIAGLIPQQKQVVGAAEQKRAVEN